MRRFRFSTFLAVVICLVLTASAWAGTAVIRTCDHCNKVIGDGSLCDEYSYYSLKEHEGLIWEPGMLPCISLSHGIPEPPPLDEVFCSLGCLVDHYAPQYGYEKKPVDVPTVEVAPIPQVDEKVPEGVYWDTEIDWEPVPSKTGTSIDWPEPPPLLYQQIDGSWSPEFPPQRTVFWNLEKKHLEYLDPDPDKGWIRLYGDVTDVSPQPVWIIDDSTGEGAWDGWDSDD